MTTFDEYQFGASATAIYPADKAVEYLALGLVSEAGEIAGKVKKVIRDSGGNFTDPDHRYDMAGELGDVLWYLACLCEEYGMDLGAVAQHNLEKLASRKERGVLGGSGDTR